MQTMPSNMYRASPPWGKVDHGVELAPTSLGSWWPTIRFRQGLEASLDTTDHGGEQSKGFAISKLNEGKSTHDRISSCRVDITAHFFARLIKSSQEGFFWTWVGLPGGESS